MADLWCMGGRARDHPVTPGEVLLRRGGRSPAPGRGGGGSGDRNYAEPYTAAIRFDSYQARWIRKRTCHPSQQIEDLDSGGLILRLEVAGAGDLLRWVLGHGPHAEVLEPEWLRERVVETVRAMAERYAAAI